MSEGMDDPTTGSQPQLNGTLSGQSEEHDSDMGPLADVLRLNAEGMEFLRNQDVTEAFKYLRQAEDILCNISEVEEQDARDPTLPARRRAATAATASNLGCCYKRVGDHPTAVGYLQRALRLHEEGRADARTLSGAHLNLYGVLSRAEMHEVALTHAQAAVNLMGRLIAFVETEAAGAATGTEAGEGEGSAAHDEVQLDDYATLAIAYHNVAVAKECLRDWKGASLGYTQAYEVAVRSLGEDHTLTKAFEQSARCPKPTTALPEPPRSWRSASSPVEMPNIPTYRSFGKVSVANRPTSKAFQAQYQLNKTAFPTWPPKGCSKEERAWYNYADRKLKGPPSRFG